MRSRTHPVVTTNAAIDAATARAEREPGPYATHATYDPEHDAIVVQVVVPGTLSPVSFAFERKRIEGLQEATPDELSHVQLECGGTGLVWPDLDIAHYLPGLLEGVFGTARWMAAEYGRRGGQSTTSAKASAARENGLKGGRPRKVAPTESPQVVHRVASHRPAAARGFTKRPAAASRRPTSPVGKRKPASSQHATRKPSGGSGSSSRGGSRSAR